MSEPRLYSPSQISMYLKCGKQWRFRYIDGLILPPGAALTVGKSVDHAVSKNLAQKVASKEDLKLGDVLDHFSTEFDKEAVVTDWTGEDKGEQKDVGAQLVAVHHSQVAPTIVPEAVQEMFVIDTDAGYSLRGVIDTVEANGTISDTKTSSRAYDEGAVSRNLQSAAYTWAYKTLRQKDPKGFRFDVLKKPTKRTAASYQKVEGQVQDADIEWLFQNINEAHKAISAGIEMPAPDGAWWCSKDWCGYWHLCKGRK